MSHDELVALLALDALDESEQADAELRYGVFPRGFESVTAALAAAARAVPPPGLREAALATAVARRRPGRPLSGVVPCTPAAAFERTVADLHALLESLSPAEWEMPAHDDHGRVRDLVAHLVGVERLAVGWLDPWPVSPMPLLPDHIAATRQAVTDLADLEPQEVARLWQQTALAGATMAGRGDPARPVAFHDLTLDVPGFLTLRTFELWAHGLDVCAATGRPPFELDDGRMATLSSRLMAVVPATLRYRGVSVGDHNVRVVLTGPAGGCHDIVLGAGSPAEEPDVLIAADTVRLCRLATRRMLVADVAPTVEGDPDLARLLLDNLDAFARD